MITVVEGKGVGAGKSYFAVRAAIVHWCQGGTVFASQSLQFKWDAIKQLVRRRYGWELQDSQYRVLAAGEVSRLHEFTAGGSDDLAVLIIVDEAQDQLNARDWNDSSKRELFQWACQSRHDNNDLMFVTQAAANIDKQVRRLATFYYSVRNLTNFPLAGMGKIGGLVRFFSLGLHHGILFVQAQLDNDGRTILERKLVTGDKGFFGCYESKSMRATRKRLGEPVAKIDLQRASSHKPMTKWLFVIAIVMLGFGVHHIYKNGLIPGAHIKAKSSSGGGEKGAGVEAVQRALPVLSTTPAPKYATREEKALSWTGNGDHRIKLKSGFYEEGRMSADGFVEGVVGGVVRIRTPNGELLYLVGVM